MNITHAHPKKRKKVKIHRARPKTQKQNKSIIFHNSLFLKDKKDEKKLNSDINKRGF